MPVIIVASITVLSVGALFTCLIADLFSDDDLLKCTQHGRYTDLGNRGG